MGAVLSAPPREGANSLTKTSVVPVVSSDECPRSPELAVPILPVLGAGELLGNRFDGFRRADHRVRHTLEQRHGDRHRHARGLLRPVHRGTHVLRALEGGYDTITATYSDGSDSGNFVQNPGNQCTPYQVPTWLGLAGPENPLYGQPGAITAVLEHDATFARYVPGRQATGSIAFYDNGVYSASRPLDATDGEQATLPTLAGGRRAHDQRGACRRLLVP